MARLQYAITQMLRQEPIRAGSRGKIVNIAPTARIAGGGYLPAYSTSKGAIVNLTRQLAVDFGPDRINVNAACPG
jgi:NAD(P)-dependent dehydrogenase (short-subunit alcohol dehydrogenase family)